jgi:hypothetical protein
MTSDDQGTGQPDPGEPPAPPADAPTEAVPPPPGSVPPAVPQAPVPQAPEAAPAPPPAAPAAPDAPAPPQAAPAAPPQWAAPPPQQPAPTWGPPPAGAPAPQQPAGWAPGAPAAAPGGAPPPDGTWNPQPATKSSNGCLKGCIIVAVILAILVAIVVIGLFWLLNQAASDLGVDPNSPGGLKQCELISGAEIDQVFGGDGAQVVPMGGIIDATIGAVLDKRVLGDANDCWILTSGTESAVTGRIARQESINASGDFQAAKAKATDGKYFGGDVSGVGDEAFCTGASEQSPSFGVLVRQGGSLVYVSLIDASFATQGDWQTTDDGVLTSPETCNLAGQVAAAVLR